MASGKWTQYRPGQDQTPEDRSAPPVTSFPKKRNLTQQQKVALGFAAGLLGVGVVIGGATKDDSDISQDLASETPTAEPLTEFGYDALVAALEEQQGSTLVREAVLFEDYANITVPYRPDDLVDERALEFTWNGELNEPGKSTDSKEAVDLADIDGTVVEGLCDQAKKLVTDPTGCYVMIAGSSHFGIHGEDERPGMIVYASNEFNQSSRMKFDLHGTVLESHPAQ